MFVFRYNRVEQIKDLRWEFGSVLSPEIKYNLSEPEIQWFNKYNKCLANYMRSLGTQGGLDLTQDIKPPKSLYIEVRSRRNQALFLSHDLFRN